MNQLGSFLEKTSSWQRKLQGSPPKGWNYSSMYEYVFKRGRAFESAPLTYKEWQTVRELVEWTEMKQCFFNCQRTIFTINPAWGVGGDKSPFEYVEGYVIGDVALPIHHAWLSLNGKVVDPTLRRHRGCFRRRTFPDRTMGIFPEGWEYYGVSIPFDKVKACIVSNKAWHTVIDDWMHDFPLLKEKNA